MGINDIVSSNAYPAPGEDDMPQRHKPATAGLSAALISLLLALPVLASEALPVDAGCVNCHGADGLASENRNAPIIAGMPATHIKDAIYAYREGARQCRFDPLMCETVLHTSDERIARLADYYAAMPRSSSKEGFDPQLAATGKFLHAEHCDGCHVRPDDPEVEQALGIPLHGQRMAYLRYALRSYMDGRRENLLDAMKMKLAQLEEGDIDALVNYYASY